MIKIDSRVKHKITGREGVAAGKATYKHEETQILVYYDNSEGKSEWNAEQALVDITPPDDDLPF